MDFFPTAERVLDGGGLSFFLCLYFHLCFFTCLQKCFNENILLCCEKGSKQTKIQTCLWTLKISPANQKSKNFRILSNVCDWQREGKKTLGYIWP
jgi:hypothetical protein